MSALQEPRPEHHGGRQPDLPLALIDHWAQLAVDRPWRYVATWAIGIGGANLGLRILLNDRSMAGNAGLAILYTVGFSVFAWRHTQRTRRLKQVTSWPAAKPADPKQSCAAPWRSGMPVRRSPAGGGPRSGRRWSCPRPLEQSARLGWRPSAPSSSRWRRLAGAAVVITAVTVALLVAAIAN
jgi:hypothetical protein